MLLFFVFLGVFWGFDNRLNEVSILLLPFTIKKVCPLFDFDMVLKMWTFPLVKLFHVKGILEHQVLHLPVPVLIPYVKFTDPKCEQVFKPVKSLLWWLILLRTCWVIQSNIIYELYSRYFWISQWIAAWPIYICFGSRFFRLKTFGTFSISLCSFTNWCSRLWLLLTCTGCRRFGFRQLFIY